ncbi:MAG: hypothetical protein GWN93_05775 [Deltaproteobacteria bacterium]|nr:hypothetical protein [Deltaproteobacteria bacterium]
MTSVKIKGEGRWLIVRNASVEPISVPHPDRDAKDSEHLSLSGWEEQVIGEEWLESPVFIGDVGRGRLELRYSDDVPSNEFRVDNVVDELTAKGFSQNAALTAWQICAAVPIPPELDYMIEMEPSEEAKRQHGPTFITNRWDLVRDQLPWLRAIHDLESRWRKRGRILGRLNNRIEQLEEMSRGIL